MNEALDLLDDKSFGRSDIFIEPPDVHSLTDEDSGEEDNFRIENLSGNQLRAAAEIQNDSLSADEDVTVSANKPTRTRGRTTLEKKDFC